MDWEKAYRKITKGIEVSVIPTYLANRSEPENSLFIWSYSVRIRNLSEITVTLRQRSWQITDAHGMTETVRGEGVVGEQPTLKPGEVFEYTSGTPLTTPSGIMVGSYDMEVEDGGWIIAEIPAFSLDSPHEGAPLN
ncbi:Co2+/Mg2+ efflux protein ApaG [Sneathiella glossodoripedis]|uniref:Co2+/Mg2+ efflux protein ApaG n=1 Tax=Sneathiella glossodoripedis TaxID=418853 RepID=UPI0004707896|nr:Co2+/Mg2+ efflux protein ApaG [Sneathiella glossodoripedis]